MGPPGPYITATDKKQCAPVLTATIIRPLALAELTPAPYKQVRLRSNMFEKIKYFTKKI